MKSEQEQGGSEPSKVAVGDASHIAERHVVGGDAHIAPPALAVASGKSLKGLLTLSV